MAKIAIRAAAFIDITPSGVNYHENGLLLVEDGRLIGFETAASLQDGIELIDRSNLFCMLGLVDTAFLPALTSGEHGSQPDSFGEGVWRAREASQVWLAGGVTCAASMGAADRLDFDLATSIVDGRIPGPRVMPALSPLVPLGMQEFPWLYGVQDVCGAEDARRAARQLIKDGAERIVLYADVPLQFHPDPYETSRERLRFSLEELREIVTQAKQAGCYVHAQAISTEAIENCIEAGVRSIGCAFGLQPQHLPRMASEKIALAPNLALGATIKQFGPAAGLGKGMIRMVSEQRISPKLLLQANETGVAIVCGTNAAFQGGDVYRECQELKRAGLKEVDILRAATQQGAESLKPYTEAGAFKPHYFSDLIFLSSNPIEDLTALSDIREALMGETWIMLEGLGKEAIID